ncbi:hypothetical protein [Burkholderia phage FLC9]|nr:hypothetical protein [Burkholderia phage FLC9]
MSKLVILPTFDLVTESLAYDDLYKLFLRGGVRSVVKNAVLSTSFQERSPYVDYQRSLQHHHSALVDFVLKKFDDYTNRSHIQINENTGEYRPKPVDLSEYMSRIGELELITQTIEEAVLVMMEDLFRTRLYHIDDQQTRWQDRDLIIGVETLTSQWGRRRAI